MKELTSCPRCDSTRLVNGRLVGHMGWNKAYFQPEHVKFMKLGTRGLYIEYESTVCIDCGLFISSTDPDEAKRVLAKMGTAELKDELKLE